MIFAAGFLLLDAVLLALAGVWLARPALRLGSNTKTLGSPR